MAADNPYVGARPLTHEQHVYGRDRERRELVDLLIAERIVLLHAPSGAGKTSLLQGRGGVADTLREEGFTVLPIARIGLACSASPHQNRYIDSLLASLEHEPGVHPAVDGSLAGLAARRGEAFGVVLIVDQFEEVLSVDPSGEHERIAFFQALGHALENRLLWALFAMRDEYVGPLAPYRPRLPTHLRATYRLGLLEPEAARLAIIQPARNAGVPFTDGAADKLVQDLCVVAMPCPDGTTERRPGPCVEPVQLQVVCHRLWRRRDPTAGAIAEVDVSGVDSVDTALAEFYAAAVAEAARGSGESERAIREWIEGDLITAGVRSQVMLHGQRERRVRDEAVRHLVDAYVLRQDSRRGIEWIEIVHDRLIDPIVKDNAAWRREHLNVMQKQAALWEERGRCRELCLHGAALDEAERWAVSRPGEITAVETQFLETSRRLRDQEHASWLRGLLAVVTVVAMLVVALGSWAWKQKHVAELAQRAEWKMSLAYGDATVAMKLLLAIPVKDRGPTWIGLANEALHEGGLVLTLRGELGYEPFAAFSSDGTKILAAAGDGTVRLVNADGSGKPVVLSAEPGSRVTGLRFSQGGNKIGSVWSDGVARVWNTDGSGKPAVLKGTTGVRFSPDGMHAATLTPDLKTIWVWNTDISGAPVVLQGHQGPINGGQFSPDGRRLVTVSFDRTARVWNIDGAGEPVLLRGHTGTVLSASFSPDGTKVVTGAADRTARVWDLGSMDRSGVPVVVLTGHSGRIEDVAFSPDGTRVITASSDGTARIWNASGAGDPIVLRAHQGSLVQAAFSPKGRRVVTASDDCTARVWNADGSGEPIVLKGHTGPVRSAAFSPDGTKVLTTSVDRTVRLWNAHGSAELVAYVDGAVTSHGVFGPDFKRMVYTDWRTGITRVMSPDGSAKAIVIEGANDIESTFSADGTRIATASEDGRARVWNADGSGVPIVLEGHVDSVWRAAFSPDGKRVVTGSLDRTARVWNADGSGEPVVLHGHEDRVIGVAFSADGTQIVTGSMDRTARVWNADGAGEPVVLNGHESAVMAVAFSPDGRSIVTGSMDHTARIWNAEGSGEPIVLKGHEGPVIAVAFSADGKHVVTGSFDGTARVWNVDGSGRSIVLRQHVGIVNVVAFDATNQRVITRSEEGDVKVWNLSVEALQSLLEKANADCLLPDERVTYLEERRIEARDHYATCERQHGRVPLPEAP